MKLTDIQILKLGKTIHHIRNSNFFYGQRFTTDRITSYEEFCTLPLLSFEILAQGYPFAYSCADTKSLISGRIQTEGKEPVMNLYTEIDLAHNAEMTGRAFSIAGIKDDDTILLISPTETCAAFASACEKFRQFLIPASGLTHEKLFNLINDSDTTCLLGDTADLVKFVETCRTDGMELTGTALRTGVFCGKALTEGTRKHIEKETGMEVYHTSSFGDFFNGLASDCRIHDGMHVWDDHYIAEIINPATGAPVPDGEDGELAVTSLSAVALPLIRFRTGKTAHIVSREKCECGLHTPKISYI